MKVDIGKVDWELLSKQKRTVVDLSGEGALGRKTRENLNGIVHFLDRIQDEAAKELGEDVVYPEVKEK